MSYKVEEYLREDGTSPYEEWFMGLDTVAAAKITIVKLKMEQGNLSNVKWFGGIEKPTRKRNRFREDKMALTRDFKETIKKRVECDPDFAKSLLHEAVDLLLDGDSATAKLILRDLINATVGFERLAEEVQKPSKSLHRMLSASGNPTMENLSTIFATIKKSLHVRIETTVIAA